MMPGSGDMDLDAYVAAIERDGYAVVGCVLPRQQVDALAARWEKAQGVDAVDGQPGHRRRGGVRNLLAIWPPAVELARSAIRRWVIPILGEDCFVVRGIFFDKTETANWKVAWHQDLTIAVRQAVEVEGFGPWSVKEGIHHVQPPANVLEGMLAVRVHLDDCGAESGPLRVLPGSHRRGRLTSGDISELARSTGHPCLVPRGGLVVMRPLLVHASSAATTPSCRRVIHLEFAADRLPGGLQWHERW
jgi:ectoine hydroxylase-related dioxygenase (phytanoyl-CoA dioxygenase family)